MAGTSYDHGFLRPLAQIPLYMGGSISTVANYLILPAILHTICPPLSAQHVHTYHYVRTVRVEVPNAAIRRLVTLGETLMHIAARPLLTLHIILHMESPTTLKCWLTRCIRRLPYE